MLDRELQEAKSKIDLRDYIEKISGRTSKRVGDGTYRINPCPFCQGKDHFTVHQKSMNEQYYKSFSCGHDGDIVNFMMDYEGLNFEAAKNKVMELAGMISYKRISEALDSKDNRQVAIKKEVLFTSMIEQLHKNINSTDYYYKRGLGKNIVERYKLGFHNDGFKHAMDICKDLNENNFDKDKTEQQKEFYKNLMKSYKYFLPVWDIDGQCRYFITRLDDNSVPSGIEKPNKTHNLKGFKTRIFNDRYIQSAQLTKKYIFVVEGIFDALSLEEIGYNSIALNSTANYTIFLELIKVNIKQVQDKVFIIIGDNDSAGRELNVKLKTGLNELGLMNEIISLPLNYNDLNEYLQKNRKALQEYIISNLNIIEKKDYVITYVYNLFLDEIDKRQRDNAIPTGFKALDFKLDGGLYPGLYVIGAISSLGKTTFILQIADYIAAHGTDVMFFSLEMSKFEIVAKSLSRESFINDPKSAAGTRDIMTSRTDINIIANSIKRYTPAAQNTKIIEGAFETGVQEIRDGVENHIKATGKKPVVVVDYLQILKPLDFHMSDKQVNDYNITELKRMSRDFEIPVIIISSLNRMNYSVPVSFESFKETGSIEYTADVIIGLQLAGIYAIADMKKESEKRERLNELKAEIPRQVELVILKQRNGIPVASVWYDFYSKYNYFAEKLIHEKG